jgi:hypothetical protein
MEEEKIIDAEVIETPAEEVEVIEEKEEEIVEEVKEEVKEEEISE